jgi:hypothetical protein
VDRDDLPPLEHFVDTLPEVGTFAPNTHAAESEGYGGESSSWGIDIEYGPTDSGWSDTGWQQFDWSAAAVLGEGAEAASDAWSATDWDAAGPSARDFRETAAQAIANALDGIAQRIRNGELVVPSGGFANPAAIADTLASLFGVRR